MKMVKSLLLLPIKGDITKAGPKFGPAKYTIIEGAGFGLYPDTEERDPDGGTLL